MMIPYMNNRRSMDVQATMIRRGHVICSTGHITILHHDRRLVL